MHKRRILLLQLALLYILINLFGFAFINNVGPNSAALFPATPAQLVKIAGAMSLLKNTAGLSETDIRMTFDENRVLQSAAYFYGQNAGTDFISVPSVYVDTCTEAALASTLAHELSHRKAFLATRKVDTRKHWEVDRAALEFIDLKLFRQGGRDTIYWMRGRISLIPTWIRITVPALDLTAWLIISDFEKRRYLVEKSLQK